MSQYATAEYYTTTFGGILIPSSDRDKYLKLASEKIDSITFNRIVRIGFDNLTSFQKDKVQDAVCYQAEYIYENGTETSDIASYSVLDIDVTLKDKQSVASQKSMSEMAYETINKTGLTVRNWRF